MRANTISKELGKSFRKSNTYSTKVSGWSTVQEGFIAKQVGEVVAVSYELGDWNKTRGEERAAAKVAKMTEVADYLTAAGFVVDFDGQSISVIAKAA